MFEDIRGFIAITDPENVYSRRILEQASFVLDKEYVNEDGEPAMNYVLI